QGLNEAPLLAQPVLVTLGQLAYRVLSPEAARDREARGLPGDRLRAVLAELQRVAVAGVGPRATHAVETILLVDREHELGRARGAQLAQGRPHRVQHPGYANRPFL